MRQSEPRLQLITVGQIRRGALAIDASDPAGLGRMDPNKERALACNPFALDEDPASIIGILNDRVVGRMDAFPSELEVDGTKHRVVYGSSLFVEEAARSSGIGLTMLLRFQALHHTVAVCGISQMIKPIYEKLGWVNFAMPRMVLIRKSRAFVETKLKSRRLSTLAGWPIDVGLAMHRTWLRSLGRTRGWVVRREDPNALQWLDVPVAKDASVVHPPRSAAWYAWELNQTFSCEPSRRVGLYSVRGADGRLVGTFVTKSRLFESVTQRHLRDVVVGSLQDWRIHDASAISTMDLCMLAVRELSGEGVDVIEICMPEPQTALMLQRRGCLRLGELNYLYKANAKSPVFPKGFREIGRWCIRPMDGDNFFT